VRAVVVTVNNYDDGDREKIQNADWIQYSIIGKEIAPTTGTPHLQGYVQVKTRMRLGGVTDKLNALLGKAVFTAAAKAGLKANKAYCSKSGDVTEDGIAVSQGERTDIKDFLAAAAEGKDDYTLGVEFPKEFAKYHRAGEKMRKSAKSRVSAAAIKEKYLSAELRTWQGIVVRKMEQQNDRKVLWIADEEGNHGKSWLGNWLMANKDAFLIEGGKVADIAHAFECQEWVAIDLTRAQAEKAEYIYSVIESFKNGRIFSPKYESSMKLFKPCKVVVFANWYPQKELLSDDRWEIISLPLNTLHARPRDDRSAMQVDVETPDDFRIEIDDDFWMEASGMPQ